MDTSQLRFQSGIITTALDDGEISALMAQEDSMWSVSKDEGVSCLRATFLFGRYQQCLDFVAATGSLAEQWDHHPDIHISYGRVVVRWWTHTASGITTNDVYMAVKTSDLALGMGADIVPGP